MPIAAVAAHYPVIANAAARYPVTAIAAARYPVTAIVAARYPVTAIAAVDDFRSEMRNDPPPAGAETSGDTEDRQRKKPMNYVLTLATLRHIAGPRFFDCGEQYPVLGLVRSITEYNGAIRPCRFAAWRRG